MNSTATYTEPVNRIKQRILFDGNLENMACCCDDFAEFVIELAEWGVTGCAKIEFDDPELDFAKLDRFIKAENGYIR